jgi:hypothetical protein
MANDMPTTTQINQAFGGKGVAVQTANTAKDLREEEYRSRKVREAQVQTNCAFTIDVDAVFTEGTIGGGFATGWIDFAELRFTVEPAFTCGSKRQAQEGEPTLNTDASNFDPAQHLTVPAIAEVLRFRTDNCGMFSGAKLLIFALGAVPTGFKVKVSAVFTGPAIRKG